MDNLLFEHICQDYQLGQLLAPVKNLVGGYSHQVYQIITNQGQYVLKQFNSEVLAERNGIAQIDYVYQTVSKLNHQQIPCLRFLREPINFKDRYLQLYYWIEGVTLDLSAVSNRQAASVGNLLAAIHMADLDIAEQPLDIEAQLLTCSWPEFFVTETLALLREYTDKYLHARVKLQQQLCVSHGDCYQPNLIWDNHGHLTLIDWDLLRPVNPDVEVLAAALNWSGFILGQYDQGIFRQLIDSYQTKSGRRVNLTIDIWYGCLASWLAWLSYLCQQSDYRFSDHGLNRDTEIEHNLSICLRLIELVREQEQ